MIKFQGYLAGSVFALFLAAYIAMVLLNAYPTSGVLWQVNIAFAREIRPLLEHMDRLAGGTTIVTISLLGAFAVLAVASARHRMRLLAAGLSHVALAMVVLVLMKSLERISYSGAALGRDDAVSVIAGLTAVQYAIIALAIILGVACLQSHVRILSHAFAYRRARAELRSARTD